MTAPADDPELRALFVDELRRHLAAFSKAADDPASRARSLHAMRGAAAMMGLGEVAMRLGELEAATRAGEPDTASTAFGEIDALLRASGFVIDALRTTRLDSSRPPGARSSIPGAAPRPSDRPSLDPEVLAFFFGEARARIERLADALVALTRPGASEALDEAFRHVHAVKGAALTVGLGSIARGAHALEAALQALKSRDRDLHAAEIDVLSTARTHLAVAMTTPSRASTEVEALVAVLRGAGLVRDHDLQPVSSLPRDRERESVAVDAMRVPVQVVAGLAESVNDVATVGDRIVEHGVSVREFARHIAGSSRVVHDALLRIGPARPWGAPADALERLQSVERTIATAALDLEREGERIARDAEALETLSGSARDALQRLGASSARWLFDRIAPAADALARREGKEVVIVRQGDDVEIARLLAERLAEPLAQLARNAVVHGVEHPATRMARGKSVRATIKFSAVVEAGRLRISIEDDGAGVNEDAVAERAIALGLLSPAQRRDRSAVLATMFQAGVSTRTRADTSAGRGVGLDLVYREVSALGGHVTVSSTRGALTRFVIEIAMQTLAQRMLVVTSGDERVALPLDRVAGVVGHADALNYTVVSLNALMREGREEPERGPVVLLVTTGGTRGLRVESVDRAREFVVRPLPTLLAGVSPWSGVTVDGDGRVVLVADVDRISPA